MGYIILIPLAIFIIVAVLSAIFAHMFTHGKRQTLEEAWQWQAEHVEAVNRFSPEMLKCYVIKGPDNEDIHVSFLPAAEPSDKYVILAHGYTDTRYGMMKYVPHYYDMGFNCVLFDERGHGENRRFPCSYGIKEKGYLLAVIEDTLSRYGKDIILGLHGESLGGATVLTSLQEKAVKENVRFVVDDCGFADIVPVLKVGMRQSHVPIFMLYPSMLAAWLNYGIKLWKARPIDSVPGNTIPLICMHGAEDDFIVPDHSKRVYEATEGLKEIHLFKGAGHAASSVVAAKEYGEVLREFLKKAGILNQ